jgi:hypothetical protein
MNTSTQRGSAVIIPFPSRTRPPSSESRDAERAVVRLPALRLANVSYGSGWYHDAAIEAERAS